MASSTDEENAKMLLSIPFPINNIMNNRLALNLIDICFDKMVQMLCKDWKIVHSKLAKIC